MKNEIDWLYWRMMGSVEPWQAAALAVGMNPDSAKLCQNVFFLRPGQGPDGILDNLNFGDDCFSGACEKETFFKLWRLAGNRINVHLKVTLSDFSSFLVAHEWPEIPEPLRMMAKGAAPALLPPESNPAPAVQVEPSKAVKVSNEKETTKQRRARRYHMCLDAGLTLPDNDYAALPRGIGILAEKEKITRQSFSEDVKAHIRSLSGR